METLKEIHKKYLNNGFWNEIDKETVLNAVKRIYKEETIEGITPTDIIINGGKVLVKWHEDFKI